MTKYIKASPSPKQTAFIWLDVLDAFFGGAAGGGKSVALLMAALQYVDIPGYNAILIRDSYKNLSMPNSLMDLAHNWLFNTDAKWKADEKKWKFPSGATLNFGYLDGPNDHFNYQSAEFQFVGIDEAVNIRKNQALYMFSRLRKPESMNVPLRFRCASNPPASEQVERGAWVKERYIDHRTRQQDGVYIPAQLTDNPYLHQDEYIKSLNQLDPITRKQLLDGDWEVKAKGVMFDRSWFKIIDAPLKTEKNVSFWDLAGTEKKEGNDPAYTARCKIGKTADGNYCITNVVRFRKTVRQTETVIRQCAKMDGIEVLIGMEQEPGSSGIVTIDYYTRVLAGFAFKGYPALKSKIDRARPFASQAEAGNVYLVKGSWNQDFLDELELFPFGKYMDQVDSASGAFSMLEEKNTGRARWV